MDIPKDRDSIFVYGFCCGLNADHKLTQAEAKVFIELLRDKPALLDAEILKPHRSALLALTKVKEVWRSHCEQAEDIAYSIIGVSKQEQAAADAPTLIFDTPDSKDANFDGAGVVFTGEFHMGRSHAEEVGMQLGAVLQSSTTFDTQYVVVGSIPSPAWKFGKFGTKVLRAIELKQRGTDIKIIREETFCSMIPSEMLDRVQADEPPFRVEGFEVSRVLPASKTTVSGKTFVLSGTLSTMTRYEAAERIELAGGRVSGAVTLSTSFVASGTDPGSKLEKALALGVPVLDEAGFIKLLAD